MAQADAEDGELAQKLSNLDYGLDVLFGVAGTVGEHHAVHSQGEHFLRRNVKGQAYDLAAPAAQAADDVLLCAVVYKSHGEFLLPLGREYALFPVTDLSHHPGAGIGLYFG